MFLTEIPNRYVSTNQSRPDEITAVVSIFKVER